MHTAKPVALEFDASLMEVDGDPEAFLHIARGRHDNNLPVVSRLGESQ